MKCVICNSKKGKRKCSSRNDQEICSECCGSSRNSFCKECFYYKASIDYRDNRVNNIPKFITELHPDIDEKCDEALQLVDRGRIDQARKMLLKLDKEKPDYHMIQYGLGVCEAFENNLDDAIKYFKRATEIYPVFTEAFFNLGTAYQKKLDIPPMINAFKTVIKIEGDKKEYGRMAKEIIDSIKEGISNSSGLELEQYLENNKIFDEAFTALKSKNYDRAILLFNKVLSTDKENVASYGNIGIAYAALGKKEEAIKYYDKALALDPNYEPAILNKVMAEKMNEGDSSISEKMEIEDVRYYAEYPAQKKSYIQSLLDKIR